MRIVMDLPFDSATCGGVIESKRLAAELNAECFFQRKFPDSPLRYPYSTLGKCDVVITYSDNPFLPILMKERGVGKVMLNMLSYGMSIDNERRNVFTDGVTVMCSTKRIEDAIIKDGGSVTRIGFGLEMDNFTNHNGQRNNYLAVYYNDMPSKRYNIAVNIADLLYAKGIIGGVISFGGGNYNNSRIQPIGLKKHYQNATKEQICEIFNMCQMYIMPSVSEGLNLTPIEATLCGCPTILSDGAIGEIFFHGHNCIVAGKDNMKEYAQQIDLIMPNATSIGAVYEANMRSVIADFKWDKVAKKILDLI